MTLTIRKYHTDEYLCIDENYDSIINQYEGIEMYLTDLDHKIDDRIYFDYTEQSLNKVYQELLDILDRFDIKYKLSNILKSELKNYHKELEVFELKSKQAKKIRDNDFDNAEELIDMFNDFKDTIKPSMVRTLYELQLLSAFHMAFSLNSLNFSVPGSGKTSIVLAAYKYLQEKGRVDKIFIIGPLSSFKAWEREYEKCFGITPVSFRYSGDTNNSREEKNSELVSPNSAEMHLISHAGVNSLKENIKRFIINNNVMLIVDEAHRMKNIEGIWGNSIVDIAPNAKSRVCLTGTPIPNGYNDIFNLIRFIYPFKHKSILKFHYSQLKDLSKPPPDKEKVERLKTNLSPYFMRIRKQDLELPEVIEQYEEIPMGIIQSEIYSFIEDLSFNLKHTKYTQHEFDFIIRATLIRLRQAAINPSLLSESLERSLFEDEDVYDLSLGKQREDLLNEVEEELFDQDFRNKVKQYEKEETPPKFIFTLEKIKSIIRGKEKVIVWTTFKGNSRLMEKILQKEKINYRVLNGDIGLSEREKTVEKFDNIDNKEFSVIIANPYAVGEAISLQKGCNNAIYLERDYNCSNFIQSKDRIHRVGSRFSSINYHYVISEDSIDEVINKRLKFKVERMSELVDDDIPFFKLVDPDEEHSEIFKELYEDYRKKTKV